MQFEKNLGKVVMLGREPNTNYFIDLHAISIVNALQTIGIKTFGSCQGHKQADKVSAMEKRPQIKILTIDCNPYLIIKNMVDIFNLIHPTDHHVSIKTKPLISSLHFGENTSLLQAQLDMYSFANLCLLVNQGKKDILKRYILLSDKSNEVLKKDKKPNRYHLYHKNLIKRSKMINEKVNAIKQLQEHPYVSTFINEGVGL